MAIRRMIFKSGLAAISVGLLLASSPLATQTRPGTISRPGNRPATRAPGAKKRKPVPRRGMKYVLHKQDVQVRRCGGTSVRGVVRLRVPEKKKLFIRHTKEGVGYTKAIRVDDIHVISFRKWRSRFVRRNRSGEIFHFIVAESKLTMRDGNSFTVPNSVFPALWRLDVLHNVNGLTSVFTFWVDLLGKDGKWHTGVPVLKNDVTSTCHKEVVKSIEFVKKDAE